WGARASAWGGLGGGQRCQVLGVTSWRGWGPRWSRCWRSCSRCSTSTFRGGTGGRGSRSGSATSTGSGCRRRDLRWTPPPPSCTTSRRRGCTCGWETFFGSTAWVIRGAPRWCGSRSPTRARGSPTWAPSGWCSAREGCPGAGWCSTPSRSGCCPCTSPETPPTWRGPARRRACPWRSSPGTASATGSRSPDWPTRSRKRATPATSPSRWRRPTGWVTPTGAPSASTPTSGPTAKMQIKSRG
ncbi:MAG: hypothetical protein AVDCRST_MAG03-1935, partial [uncultured Rubrobacteraceae bacterium]